MCRYATCQLFVQTGCIVRNLRTYVCVAWLLCTSIVDFCNLQSRGLNLFPRR
ncbi:hypothetical protein ACHAXM_011671, partial [Skeletonema potamos]